MNKSTRLLVLALALAPAWVMADPALPKDKSDRVAAVIPGADEEAAARTGKMQDRMLRMHEQMHKIMQTKDGVERERLLQEHRMMIEENMHLKHSMKDCPPQDL